MELTNAMKVSAWDLLKRSIIETTKDKEISIVVLMHSVAFLGLIEDLEKKVIEAYRSEK